MCSTASCGGVSRAFWIFTWALITGTLSTSPIPQSLSAAGYFLSVSCALDGRRPMFPELIHFKWLTIPTYGVLVAAAFLTALWIAGKLAKEQGLNTDAVTNLGIYCALSALAGAKLMMFLVDIPYYREHPGDIFSLGTLRAGGVFYGGLIAALGVSFWYMRKTKLPALKTADVFAPAIALGHGIGRIGCFMAGCC